MKDLKIPGEYLLGLKLDGGWTVVERLARQPGSTGGNFSLGYIAQNDAGHRAFLKAIDITKELQKGDPRALQDQTEIYNHEKELLEICQECSRIVTAVAAGSIPAGTIPDCFPSPVFYLIFELAVDDARSHANKQKQLSLSQIFRSLQQIAAGVQQLHTRLIAHQDLKPSNVLMFNARDEQILNSKIADLGRADKQDKAAPRILNELNFAGARGYAPLELLYRSPPDDWRRRRFGCDLYTLGNMVAYYFSGVSVNAVMAKYLSTDQHWNDWRGFYADAMPFVRHAFNLALGEIEEAVEEYLKMNSVPEHEIEKTRNEIVEMIKQLCEPDPVQRGYPKTRLNDQYNLERYISAFNRLASSSDIWRRTAKIGETRTK